VLDVLKRLNLIPAASVSLLAAACASVPVHTDTNPAVMHACHTYWWAGSFQGNGGLHTTVANPLNESRLRDAIAANMQSRGIVPAGPNNPPDCLIGYGIGSQTVVYGPGPYAGWGWGPYAGPWGWYGPGYGYGTGPYAYREGIIGVDIYDARTREPMWHAHASQDLAGATGPEAEKRIGAAVQAIFAKYPG
jgi:hypothetical protein